MEGLGWNFYHIEPIKIPVKDYEYTLRPVAEKAGFAVFVCSPNIDGEIPDYPIRRMIEQQVTSMAFEHLIIFIDADETIQVWQWIKRTTGKSPACREYTFYTTQTGTLLLQRLKEFIFTLEQESKGIVITDVTAAVRKALDVEKVTKRFYNRFKMELNTFQKFIDGIINQDDREWYASLMLNRMMFVYFVQKQGFLDSDVDYLRNRLRMVQSKYGSGRFQQFYRDFLIKLFHEGLGQPEPNRDTDTELSNLLGKVPYLNGGLFDVHDLERNYPKISIPDDAFKKIFNFFDSYNWHLDERPRREDNEINPDVLGYIFEKYINQKQMGAYYTKDDITGYITRNTVIPFLFDVTKKECMVAFSPRGGIWRLLQDNPDRYIYAAVGHGFAWNYSSDADPQPLKKPLKLPNDITAGLDDVSKRGGWNRPAPAEYALPTETWREVVARRLRYQEVRDKMVLGKITDVNDIITLNLDIERFAKDVIEQCEGPELLRALWRSINDVSVLDPTCGSGAFLFAALNILEPLYAACLESMRGFVADLERSQRPRSPNTLSDFRDILKEADKHPNQRYFILRSIILKNLYGVDIMEEAVEICKLRLFLKLMAQLDRYAHIEPLPDIDFNIRTGNTLVGFTSLDAVQKAMRVLPSGQSRLVSDDDRATLKRINEAAEIASHTFDQFRSSQASQNKVLPEIKAALRSQFDILRDELDSHMAAEYGVDAKDVNAYDVWRTNHKPFHWFVEFHGIIKNGGFDVVVGNPPYLEYRVVDYKVHDYSSSQSRAIHAFCIERSAKLNKKNGRLSMIVPISLTSTQRMKSVQNMIESSKKSAWYANFAWRPGKLFDTVNRALTIFVNGPSESPHSYSTGYTKWTSTSRHGLFERIVFSGVPRSRPHFWVPKISNSLEQSLLKKVVTIPTLASHFMGRTNHDIFYRTTGGLYWKVFLDFAPAFYVNGKQTKSSRETTFSVQTKKYVKTMIAILSSDIFWWWYTITSNLRDLNPVDIREFPIPKSVFFDSLLTDLGRRYISSLIDNSTMLVRRQKQTGRTETQSFKVSESKSIIDEIDRSLAKHYKLTVDELDFITNYDIKYRMSL